MNLSQAEIVNKLENYYVCKEFFEYESPATASLRADRALESYKLLKADPTTVNIAAVRDLVISWYDTVNDSGIALTRACGSACYEHHAKYLAEQCANAVLSSPCGSKFPISDLSTLQIMLLKLIVWFERGIFPRVIKVKAF